MVSVESGVTGHRHVSTDAVPGCVRLTSHSRMLTASHISWAGAFFLFRFPGVGAQASQHAHHPRGGHKEAQSHLDTSCSGEHLARPMGHPSRRSFATLPTCGPPSGLRGEGDSAHDRKRHLGQDHSMPLWTDRGLWCLVGPRGRQGGCGQEQDHG